MVHSNLLGVGSTPPVVDDPALVMDQAVRAFRRHDDASPRYTGIDSHPGLRHYGLHDTVVAREV